MARESIQLKMILLKFKCYGIIMSNLNMSYKANGLNKINKLPGK